MKKIPSLILALLVISCVQYDPIAADQVTVADIQFLGQDEEPVHTQMHYSVPPTFHPKKASPLVIALHGSGSSSAAFHDLWKTATDSCGFILLTVQGEEKSQQNIGWTWGRHADQSILVAMDVLSHKVNFDRNHVYIAGFSSGGRLAYFMALSFSNIFNGVAALSAQFETEFAPRYLFNNQRVYIAHGALESDLIEHALAAKTTFDHLGSEVLYKQFPGIGHTLPEPKTAVLIEILNYMQNNIPQGE